MSLSLFLAKRIYKDPQNKEQASRPAIRIATIGVAIGIIVMLLSTCIILGFKQTIKDKVVGFGGHIQVANFLTHQTTDSYPIIVNDSIKRVIEKIDGVQHVSTFALKQGILKTNTDFLGISFKGVTKDFDNSFITQHLISGKFPLFGNPESKKSIVISATIANKLNLKEGDKVFAYFIDDNDVRIRTFRVAGIYETNLSLFDNVTCFIDLQNVIKLNNWTNNQATGMEVTINNFDRLNEVSAQFVNKINRTVDAEGNTYSSQTIKELVPQIFSWLNLLDINVWIILSLMILVASVTMVSGLLIIILERTNMIGLLKALGAKNKVIRSTFLYFAFFIIVRGMIIGNSIAFLLLLIQKYMGVVKLDANIYYVSVVPVQLHLPIIVLINLATVIISILVLIIPSYLIAHIHPSKSIKYE